MSAAFKKVVENFVCGNCANMVSGSGYTNHCPKCLWSKHVDIEPGDRAATCHGMMKPIDLEAEGSDYMLTLECEMCSLRKRNKTSETDDQESIVALSKELKSIDT